MTQKVVVLGGSGMLGSMVVDYLSREADLKVAATVRNEELVRQCRERLSNVDWLRFDVTSSDFEKALSIFDGFKWIINAIGIIKPLIHDDNAVESERAIRINSLFPHQLALRAHNTKARILQIATDCVYSGQKGEYIESDSHDALDVYGKTKSLGEVIDFSIQHLRCSIIGPEPKAHLSLLDWFLNQPYNGRVGGYTNHRWNGVTTLHFAKLCCGIIKEGADLPHLQHIIPQGKVTKCELLQLFARSFHREDVLINPTNASVVIDRTLITNNKQLNQKLWALAGYATPPSVPEMVNELASYDYRLAGLKTKLDGALQ